jgi:hypothetical protein
MGIYLTPLDNGKINLGDKLEVSSWLKNFY